MVTGPSRFDRCGYSSLTLFLSLATFLLTLKRVLDYNVMPGVSNDEGDGDEWPQLREKVLAADTLIIAAPTWLGQPSSVAKRVLERI
ncbi:MAG: hypothetical protein AVDCRST_MAG93-9192, partial [uncultured Chloroflexia bacterium]